MTRAKERVVLALYPATHGFSFCVFRGGQLIDWGIKGIKWKDKNFLALSVAKQVIERFAPDVLVLEDMKAKGARRHERVRALNQLIAQHARTKKIAIKRFAQRAVHDHFGVHTKHAMAETIAEQLPLLKPRLPSKRKTWQAEDRRQSLFDAAGLGLLYIAGGASR